MNNAAARAAALIGTRVRLKGRDPAIALDCIGLVLNAYGLPVEAAPHAYGLRGHALKEIDDCLICRFRRITPKAARVGDLMVLRCAADRFHFGVVGEQGLIHADVVIGRVLCRPWPAQWPVARVYRKRQRRS